MLTFPNDSNGNTLRRLDASGDRLNEPRDIDFSHLFQEEYAAMQFAVAVQRTDFKRVRREFSQTKHAWDVCVTVFMLPTHAAITATESKLKAIAREFHGRADGRGMF